MKDIPKERSNILCPICHRRLLRTYWSKVKIGDVTSDNMWRYCCDSIIETSFGVRACYFDTPVIRLPLKYKGEINWSKIKHLTSIIHPVIKKAMDKAIKEGKFV